MAGEMHIMSGRYSVILSGLMDCHLLYYLILHILWSISYTLHSFNSSVQDQVQRANVKLSLLVTPKFVLTNKHSYLSCTFVFSTPGTERYREFVGYPPRNVGD